MASKQNPATETNKYKATWVSHSSISDFLACPRLYFLRNVYKDPITGNKIAIAKPALSLGQAVHDVVESLSFLPVEERLKEPLTAKLEKAWKAVEGKRGGFFSLSEEEKYKALAREMLERVEKSPGPLLNKAVKIPQELPHYWLSEDDEIILCGKIDWLEYLPDSDNVHIIDFKTGKIEESEDSLQLPIYRLLVANTQGREVAGASYWYLRKSDTPEGQELPETNAAYTKVYDAAKRVKLARQLEHFVCQKGGCKYCLPYEAVVSGKGELVAKSEYNQDIYVI